ncbi:thioredoxin family protein [Weizmannia acidilactici]|uniref:Thioredoxin family protein n=1 Tax=Weizmannia acidilactici TaxID=2607726 RepID=A0A5J4J420_9BACI|nr:glutaredoxin family protein [Weizmannia acidilactici]GER65935.1 thioredoxin family protein [Weizmannia acidilactici]GER69736.1 thioredoxin family protein [Weizmannia acidilactici]GER74391.1 thioredoxin family protein [Weizmannia acidilactici]
MELTLYTRKHCPLCEEAKELLHLLQKEIPFRLVERDIEKNDGWMERYGLMIPVVEFEGEVIQYGRIHEFAIRQRLHEKIDP